MIPEAPFLFSIAGVSASLAGLAGLVAALRRGSDARDIGLFRLREIVEFAFATVLVALSTLVLAPVMGNTGDAFRVEAVIAIVYAVTHIGVLVARTRRYALAASRGWTLVAVGVNLAILGTGAATLVSGSPAVFEALLLVLLARPMLAFLLVLASFEKT